jgi:hypothetical protein
MSEQFTAEQAHAAVARGAAFLDKKCPGWELEIDLAKLDISRGDACVLGQTAHCLTKGAVQSRRDDSFQEALFRITRSANQVSWGYKRGFCLSNAGSSRERDTAYEILRIAWSVLIRERLAVPAHV